MLVLEGTLRSGIKVWPHTLAPVPGIHMLFGVLQLSPFLRKCREWENHMKQSQGWRVYQGWSALGRVVTDAEASGGDAKLMGIHSNAKTLGSH